MDAGTEQALRRINIANADNPVAVHQSRFNRGFESFERSSEPQRREFIGQWLDAQDADQWVSCDIARPELVAPSTVPQVSGSRPRPEWVALRPITVSKYSGR